MRGLQWWSREALVGALILAPVMASVLPVVAYGVETFTEVTRGQPPPPTAFLGPAVVGFISGGFLGACVGAWTATRRRWRQRGRAALPELISTLLECRSKSARILAAELLADMGPPARAALPALRIALHDECEEVRQVVANTLARIEQETRHLK